MSNKVLVIAPHPDDEVLGVGGTIARYAAEGKAVDVAIVTKGQAAQYTEQEVQLTRDEARQAHKILGVSETIFLDLPAAGLDGTPHATINKEIGQLISRSNPDVVFAPFIGDIHRDHQEVALSTLVGCRPNLENFPRKLYFYETLSETNWNAPYVTSAFVPTCYIDISDYLETKLEAAKAFSSQMQKFPHERSLQVLKSLAQVRGGTVCTEAAEAFVLVRELI